MFRFTAVQLQLVFLHFKNIRNTVHSKREIHCYIAPICWVPINCACGICLDLQLCSCSSEKHACAQIPRPLTLLYYIHILYYIHLLRNPNTINLRNTPNRIWLLGPWITFMTMCSRVPTLFWEDFEMSLKSITGEVFVLNLF